VPLLLLDLDNTLIDRAAAFRRWAVSFAAAHGESQPAAAAWLIEGDRDGFKPRERFAAEIQERFGLTRRQEDDVLAELRAGLVENITLDPALPDALDRARAAGWDRIVVTNGTVVQQERKLRHTGLVNHVDGWVISEGAGIRKPDPGIFRLAAERAGCPLDGAWMIGDSPELDIQGARNVGISSVWLRRDRTWAITDFKPTLTKDTCAAAIDAVIATAPSVH
jgi:putative hydrolase of the HAD superfamily